jgi:biotin carboxylase
VTGPFIFIATNRLKPGKLDDEKKRVPGLVDFVQANEPRLLAFNEFVNEDGSEVAVVQVHPDADSMAFHMEVIAERAASAYADTIDATTSLQVFGTPGSTVIDLLRRQAGAGVPLSVKPYHLGGFTR